MGGMWECFFRYLASVLIHSPAQHCVSQELTQQTPPTVALSSKRKPWVATRKSFVRFLPLASLWKILCRDLVLSHCYCHAVWSSRCTHRLLAPCSPCSSASGHALLCLWPRACSRGWWMSWWCHPKDVCATVGPVTA